MMIPVAITKVIVTGSPTGKYHALPVAIRNRFLPGQVRWVFTTKGANFQTLIQFDSAINT
jgi:hypothetical protein